MSKEIVLKNNLISELRKAPIGIIKETYNYFEYLKKKAFRIDENKAMSGLSVKKFNEIWDNEEDAVYDKFLQ